MKILRTKSFSDKEKKDKKDRSALIGGGVVALSGIGTSQAISRIDDRKSKKVSNEKVKRAKDNFDEYVKEKLIPHRRAKIQEARIMTGDLPDSVTDFLKSSKIKSNGGDTKVENEEIKRIKDEALSKYRTGKQKTGEIVEKEKKKLEDKLKSNKKFRKNLAIGSLAAGTIYGGLKKLTNSKKEKDNNYNYDKEEKKEKALRGISYGTKIGAIGSAVIPVRNIIKSEKEILKERYPKISTEDLMEKWTSKEFENYRDKMSEKAQKMSKEALKYYEGELPKSEIKYLKHLKNGPKIAAAAIPLAATSIGTKVAYKRLAAKRKKRENEALKKVMEEQNKNN